MRLALDPKTGTYLIIENVRRPSGSWGTRSRSLRTKDRQIAEMMFAQVKRDIEAIETEQKLAAQGTTIAELVGLYTRLYMDKRGIHQTQREALKPIVATLGHLEPEGVTNTVWMEYEASRKHHLTGNPISSNTLRRELKALKGDGQLGPDVRLPGGDPAPA